jgi:hypothetical protein
MTSVFTSTFASCVAVADGGVVLPERATRTGMTQEFKASHFTHRSFPERCIFIHPARRSIETLFGKFARRRPSFTTV